MHYLPSGCSYSEFNVFPANWHTARASLKKKWRVEYRFHDPATKDKFPKGHPKVLKSGVNRISSLSERQQFIKDLIANEKELLENQAYNPIPGKAKPEQAPKTDYTAEADSLIDPNTPFIKALKLGLEQKSIDPESKKAMRSTIVHIQKAAEALKINGNLLSMMPIQDIRRRHIRLLLSKIGENKAEKWTANNFNHYRTEIKRIFNELNELEATEVNPVDGIKKRVSLRGIRATLTIKERNTVDQHLKKNYYTFWRFTQIFFHSGCRETELLRVQFSDVNLDGQYFKVLVKKGAVHHIDKRAINVEALPLWQEIMNEANAAIALANQCQPTSNLNQHTSGSKDLIKLYLFSDRLKPMYKKCPIRTELICRRWNKYVKVPLGITADFYPLKHLRTTEDVNKEVKEAITEAQRKAAQKNGHTTSTMVRTVYDVNNKERLLEIDKTATNTFA